MKKIGIGQTINTLANIGVIAGILFLAYELRQNTQAVQLASAESYLSGGSALDLRIAQDPELAALLIRASRPEPLTDIEELQVERFNYATLRQWETAYYLSSIGALDGNMWSAYRQEISKILLRTPNLIEYWEGNKQSFTPGFGRVVETILVERNPE